MRGQIRQGDVLLVPVDIDMPEGLKAKSEVCLAEGELTGHSHVLTAPQIFEWEVEEQRYVRIEGDDLGKLKHEDHDPEPVAVVEPNVTYRVIPQQEVDLSGQWQRVID